MPIFVIICITHLYTTDSTQICGGLHLSFLQVNLNNSIISYLLSMPYNNIIRKTYIFYLKPNLGNYRYIMIINI